MDPLWRGHLGQSCQGSMAESVSGPMSSTAKLTLCYSGQPVSHPDSDPAHSLHSSNPGGQFRTEQAGVGSLESDPPNCSQSQINRRGRVLLLLEIDPVPQNHGAVEGETWFRAVPVDKLGYGMVVGPPTAF